MDMESLSQPTPALNAALAAAKPEFETIVADELADFPTKNGGRMQFYYADLSDIHPAITKALSKNGLVLSSQIRPFQNLLFLVTSLRHSSGEQIESWYPVTMGDEARLPGELQKNFGIGITYARRYNVLCLLELSTDSDEESKKKRQTKTAIAVRKEIFDSPDFQKPTIGRGASNKSANPESSPFGVAPFGKAPFDKAQGKQGEQGQSVPEVSSSSQRAIQPKKDARIVSASVEEEDLLDRYTRESAALRLSSGDTNADADSSPVPTSQYLFPQHNAQMRKLRERHNISTSTAKTVAAGRTPGNLPPAQFVEMVKELAIAHIVETQQMTNPQTATSALDNALVHIYSEMPVIDAVDAWLSASSEFPAPTSSFQPPSDL